VSYSFATWSGRICVAGFLALMMPCFADEAPSARPAPGQAKGGPEVRRVWVLSDQPGYSASNRAREIVVYDLVCEQGKMIKVSDGFEVPSGPKFGEGWVVRARGALTAGAAEEQVRQALADVCGI
jgi:hypothetical protein